MCCPHLRVPHTGTLAGATVEATLEPFAAEAIRFFTNSLGTRTRGFDLSTRYRRFLLGDRYTRFLWQHS